MAQVLEQTTNLVPLAEVIARVPAEHELQPGFRARLAGPLVGGDVVAEAEVRAVLELTVVVDLGDRRRGLARIPNVLVDPEAMVWVRKGRPLSRKWLGRHPSEDVADELQEQRRASDERAVRDQERRRREVEKEQRQQESPAAGAGAPVGEVLDDQVGHGRPDPAPAPHVPAAPGPADGIRQGARSCRRCRRSLRSDNRDGTCTRCRLICPDCGGGKAAVSERCRACSRAQRGGTPAASGHQVAGVQEVDVADPDQVAPVGPSLAAGDHIVEPLDDGSGPGSPPVAGEIGEQPVAVGELGPEPSPREEEGGAPAGVAFTASGDEVEAEPDDVGVEVGGARGCERCGAQLPRHNHLGVCTRCQTTCPTCGGAKAAQAEQCRLCRWRPAGLAVEALETAQALEDLPELVRDLHEQYVTLARYARDLEDELAAHCAADRRRRRAEQLATEGGRS